MDSKRQELLQKAGGGERLKRDEAMELMGIPLNSIAYYALLHAADSLTREIGGVGHVFAQVGINLAPCPANCGFCSMGERHDIVRQASELSQEEVEARVLDFHRAGAEEIFLMTTANYPFARFLEIAGGVRQVLPPDKKLVANIGDFGPEEARSLRAAGITGAYHIVRLGEGRDSSLDPAERVRTLEAIKTAGLDLYYCVEPIGPEHSPEEIVQEMFRGKEFEAAVMAAMRRVPVPGTPLAGRGMISELHLSKITAITRLVMGNGIRAMGVHEPSLLSLIAGANQIYAETGASPRDTERDTSRGRGFSVNNARQMLAEAGYGAASQS